MYNDGSDTGQDDDDDDDDDDDAIKLNCHKVSHLTLSAYLN